MREGWSCPEYRPAFNHRLTLSISSFNWPKTSKHRMVPLKLQHPKECVKRGDRPVPSILASWRIVVFPNKELVKAHCSFPTDMNEIINFFHKVFTSGRNTNKWWMLDAFKFQLIYSSTFHFLLIMRLKVRIHSLKTIHREPLTTEGQHLCRMRLGTGLQFMH